jgi:hypothetical protein
MKKFRLFIICVSVVLIIVILFVIDYQNLISRSNLGALLGIIAMSLNILSMILSNRNESKTEHTKKR